MTTEPTDQDRSNTGWLATLSDGGLPQILLGPAGNAISRLLGCAVEIPASYIDGFSQRIKDRNNAKSKLFNALTDKAIDAATSDPENIRRAFDSIALRVQTSVMGSCQSSVFRQVCPSA